MNKILIKSDTANESRLIDVSIRRRITSSERGCVSKSGYLYLNIVHHQKVFVQSLDSTRVTLANDNVRIPCGINLEHRQFLR